MIGDKRSGGSLHIKQELRKEKSRIVTAQKTNKVHPYIDSSKLII